MDYPLSVGVYHSMKNFYNVHTIWLLMVALTLTTYAVGQLGFSGLGVIFFVLLTTLIKGAVIIRDFMELKGVSLIWQLIMYGWLSAVCFAIATAYYISV